MAPAKGKFSQLTPTLFSNPILKFKIKTYKTLNNSNLKVAIPTLPGSLTIFYKTPCFIRLGREPTPCLGIVDSQSVKLFPMILEHTLNGRKRQILVDVIGRI